MPRKAKSKDSTTVTGSTKAEAAEKKTDEPKAKTRGKRAKRRVQASTRPSRGKAKRTPKAAPQFGGRGIRYSNAQRQEILATAKRENLTGAQVRDRFGVSTLTYYTWRKKTGAGTRRKGRAAATGRAVGKTLAGAVNLADAIRHEVRAHIARLLPEILRSEVGKAVSGATTRRRRRRLA